MIANYLLIKILPFLTGFGDIQCSQQERSLHSRPSYVYAYLDIYKLLG